MKPDQANEHRAVGGASSPRGSQSNPEGSPATQEQFRVVISREANAQIEKCIVKACQGFDPSALTRTDIANYVFCNLPKLLSDADFKALRALHFDEKRLLSSILKSENELPEEIRKALRDHYGLSEPAKKRALRAAPESPTDAGADTPPAA
jgi:hypothetical protein